MGTASDIHGISIRAWRRFVPGESIGRLTGEVFGGPTVHSIQVGVDRHLELADQRRDELAFRHLNHSCEPNTTVDTTGRVLRAIAPISELDELTFDYLTTEWRMARPFACRCGASRCRGWIAGFAECDDVVRAELWERAAPHLHELALATGLPAPQRPQ